MRVSYIWNWLSNNATNVIAICALVATLWQAYVTRKHNRVSVKPYLIAKTAAHPDNYSIVIENNGIGPAVINGLHLYLDGDELSLESVEKVLKKILTDYDFNYYLGALDRTTVVNAGGQLRLFEVIFLGAKIPPLSYMRLLGQKVKIRIKYESMYGEKYNLKHPEID